MKLGIADVLGDPEADIPFLEIVFDEISMELVDPARDIEVMIHQVAVVYLNIRHAKQLEQIFGVVATMANPRAAEDLPPVQIEPAIAAQAIVVTREQTHQLGPQLRRKTLIRVEPEHPLDVWLQLFQSPAP